MGRTRAIQVNVAVPEEARAAAIAYAKANVAKNEASRAETKAQKDLQEIMAKANDGKPWSFVEVVNGDTYDVDYFQTATSSINVKKLHEMVPLTSFLTIVTASQKAVKDESGNNIASACLTSGSGDYKATVKKRKK